MNQYKLTDATQYKSEWEYNTYTIIDRPIVEIRTAHFGRWVSKTDWKLFRRTLCNATVVARSILLFCENEIRQLINFSGNTIGYTILYRKPGAHYGCDFIKGYTTHKYLLYILSPPHTVPNVVAWLSALLTVPNVTGHPSRSSVPAAYRSACR